MSLRSRGQPTRGGPPAWGLGEALTTPPHEKQNCSEILMGEIAGACEYGNELPGSIKCGEFLD